MAKTSALTRLYRKLIGSVDGAPATGLPDQTAVNPNSVPSADVALTAVPEDPAAGHSVSDGPVAPAPDMAARNVVDPRVSVPVSAPPVATAGELRQPREPISEDAPAEVMEAEGEAVEPDWALARTMPDASIDAWLQPAAHYVAADDDKAAMRLLREAAALFPDSIPAQYELGQVAERLADWETAEAAWRRCLELGYREPWPITSLSAALRAQDKLDAAEAVVVEGLAAFPDDVDLTVEHGQIAAAREDWPTAAQRWKAVVANWPEHDEALSGLALALLRLGQKAEVGALLARLAEHAPSDTGVLHDLARLAEERHDWPLAERFWRSFNEQVSHIWWSHAALATALRQQGRDQEAEAVLLAALPSVVDQHELLGRLASLAQERGDHHEALRRWDDVIARFPALWVGYRGRVEALTAMGRAEEADAALLHNAARFPDDVHALHDIGRRSERHEDWPAAERAWRGFLRHQRGTSWACSSLANALLRLGRAAEAQQIMATASQEQPGSLDVAMDAARLSERIGDWHQAREYWAAVARLSPAQPIGAVGEARALSRLGEYAAADGVIETALARLPDEPTLHEAYGTNAVAREDWPTALSRLRSAQRRFPSIDALRQRLYEVENRLSGEGQVVAPDPEAEGKADDLRTLALAFESLGGGGHGCEFGIFQRDCGAEPLGLLRWADVFQDSLATALETEFAGVGDPEHTEIFIPEHNNARAEYWTRDRRYHMAMRCFVFADEVPLAKMRQQQTKRTHFLRHKLMDDLRVGTKIFVYKNMKRNLTGPEVERLYAACRRYGDNTLFYIRYEDGEHPNGTVEMVMPGLMVGYIDHFSHNPDTDAYIGPVKTSLSQLCRRAHRLWQDDDRAFAELPAAGPETDFAALRSAHA